ncbi:MAG: hypothetical protein Kilf2KO_01110 [Rhodospirillales bacterium]
MVDWVLAEREVERLEALRRFQILDTPAEAAFDHITGTVARQLRVPIALVSFIDEERQWFKSCYGLDICETPRELAFCTHALDHERALVVPDATLDPRFRDNILVTGPPGVRSYCGAPLRTAEGLVLGTLCVVDMVPRTFAEQEIALLEGLAPVVVNLLEFRLSATREIARESMAARVAQERVRVRSRDLQASEERFGDLAANLPGLVYRLRIAPDGSYRLLFISDSVKQVLGFSATRMTLEEGLLERALHPDDLAGFEASLADTAAQMVPIAWQGRLMTADGCYGWFRGSATPRRLDDGTLLCNGILLEITDQVRAEEDLRQAQKLQAVGQLTGGIAHDFNNLLAVVQGNAELLGDEVGETNPAVAAILRVSGRGAELTQRLLAFSRQQALSPSAVDLGRLVADVSGLLLRTLGGQIAIETEAASDLWLASVDSGQVENAVLNLALNARDAMPDGGTIRIDCANLRIDAAQAARNGEVEPGDYVVLRVRDEGQGMSASVQARVFEPFFTTKRPGEGSGLGLSMVYGFVRQSGGHAVVESEVGSGSAVSLWLPRAFGREQVVADRSGSEDLLGRGERILVIEDDPDVAGLVRRQLADLGYRVEAFSDSEAASRRLTSGPKVDLILSDVMLPGGGSGSSFAQRARSIDPDVRVVFMSGYPEDGRLPLLQPGEPLLMKPFRKNDLASFLREALDDRGQSEAT